MHLIYKFFYFIKSKLHFLWIFISYLNSILFCIFYPGIKIKIRKYLTEYSINKFIDESGYKLKTLDYSDIEILLSFLQKNENKSIFFQPFQFSKKKLKFILSSNSFINFGIFHGKKLIGYFFLRLFINKKSFLGLLIDYDYRGKGISKIILKILYDFSKLIDFNLYSTIWKENINSYYAHQKFFNMELVFENPNYCTYKIIGEKSGNFK